MNDATNREYSTKNLNGIEQDAWQVLQAVMENSNTLLAYLDADFNFVWVNSAYVQQLGHGRQALLGRGFFDFFPNQELEQVFDQVRQTGQPVDFKAKPFRAFNQPGQDISYWDWRLEPVASPDGRVRGLVLALSEVTAQVRVNQRMEEVVARDNAILTNMTDGLIVFDAQGTILELNPAAHRLHQLDDFGGGRKALSSFEQLFEFRHLDDEPLPFDRWPTQRVLQGEEFAGYMVRGRRKESDYSWVGSYSGAPMHDEAGELVLGVLTVRDVTVQQEAQANLEQMTTQLEAEQARLRAIIAHAPEAIAVADVEGNIVLTNPAAEKLEGWLGSLEKRIGKPAQPLLMRQNGSLYKHNELPLTRAARQRVIIRDEEMVLKWQDGQRRELLVSAAPFTDQQNRVAGAVGIFQDITDLKRTQSALQRYVGRLQVLRQIDSAILMASSVHALARSALRPLAALFACHWNGVVLFDREAGQGELVASTFSKENQVQVGWTSNLQLDWPFAALSKGETVSIEKEQMSAYALSRALQPSGMQSLVSVPLMAWGELIGALNFAFGSPGELNSEQKEVASEVANHLAVGIRQVQLQEQVQNYANRLEKTVARRTARLRASEARFRTVFEDSGMGIALLNQEGRLLDANAALQTLLGYDAQELGGQLFTDLVLVEESAADVEAYADLLAGKRNFGQIETRFVRRDGRLGWANVTLSLIKRAVNAERFAIGMVEDITERKDAQEALIQAEKLAVTGRLAASMVHEINNPLQSVIGFLALAEETLSEGGDVENYLQIAREELVRTAGIVGQLRSLQRRSDLDDRELTDINQLVDQVLTLSQRRCERRQVELDWKPAKDLAAVPLVADRVQQVFLNLVLNALEAMPDGGRLTVRTQATHDPDGIEVTFADTGKGIPAEILSQIFEPFFTTKHNGMGLGLHVSYKIIEQHAGRLDVDSQVDRGSTFRVWLPVKAKEFFNGPNSHAGS